MVARPGNSSNSKQDISLFHCSGVHRSVRNNQILDRCDDSPPTTPFSADDERGPRRRDLREVAVADLVAAVRFIRTARSIY